MIEKPEELIASAADKAAGVLDAAADRAIGVVSAAADRATGVVSTAADLAATALNGMQELAQRRFRWSIRLLVVLCIVIGAQAFVVVHFYNQHTTDQATITALKTKNATLGNDVATLDQSLAADHGESVQLFCLGLTPAHVTSPIYMKYCPAVIP